MKGLLLATSLVLASVPALAANLPSVEVPNGLGVNIHFTGEPTRDLDMLAAAGFRFIRMDFHWSGIEKEKGVYQFEAYDKLTDGLQKRGIRPLYILDYSNKLYEKENSVRTEEGRKAFANFAAAAAKHYRGRGVIWELWNEPNIGFWKPQPGVNDYMKLAKETLPAIRKADPDATLIAPASAGVAFEYLEECFRQGLLQMVDAVSCHPYRQQNPETVTRDYLRLRALIARYRPDKPDLPIISGEWGYSAAWGGFNEQRQGLYVPRELLTNLSQGVPLSIYYDWHDDGPDPKEPEHHFGTVTLDYQPKPAYLGIQRLTKALTGMRFVKRLQSAPEDWLLLFSNGQERTIAAWTTGADHEAAVLPGGKTLLTGEVQYLPVPKEAEAIRAEGAWLATTRCAAARGGTGAKPPFAPVITVRVRNPFARKVTARFSVATPEFVSGRFVGASAVTLAPGEEKSLVWRGQAQRVNAEDFHITVTGDVAGTRAQQTVSFVLINKLNLDVAPSPSNTIAVSLQNPSGDSFRGTLQLLSGAKTAEYSVRWLPQGQGVEVVPAAGGKRLPVQVDERGTATINAPIKPDPAGVRAILREGKAVIADSGVVSVVPITVSAQSVRAVNDGDAAVPAKFTLTDAVFTEGDLVSLPGLRFNYDYAEGWKFVRLTPAKPMPLTGKPHAIGVWVKGDGKGCSLRMRFIDNGGRTYQAEYGGLDFTGWRYLTAPLDNPHVGHWGNDLAPEDIIYPIRIDSLALVDGQRHAISSEVAFAGFHLIYREPTTK